MNALIYVVNFAVAIGLLRYEYTSDNDKSFFVISTLYLLLIATNLVVGLVAQLRKRTYAKHYYLTAGLLFASVYLWMLVWVADIF